MKYLDQINLFNDFTEVYDLSMAAQLLWFKLMHLNNRARWAKEMKINNQTLMGYLKINSASSLIRARKELSATGLIEYKSGVYKIKELVRDCNGIHAVTPGTFKCESQESEPQDPKETETEKSEQEEETMPEVKPKKKRADNVPYDEIMTLWNAHHGDLPTVTKMTEKRKRQIRKLIKDGHTLDDIKTVILKTEKSDFLNGRKCDWSADFSWIIETEHFVKILEGNYDDKMQIQQTIIEPDEDLYAAYR